MSKLILLRGLPGSGKSSFAKFIQDLNSEKLQHVEADMWFDIFNNGVFTPSLLGKAHKWSQEETALFLIYGHSVIVSNTSTTEAEVKTYEDIARGNNAEFISLIVENRHGNESLHEIPESTIIKMKNRFSVKL